jgi:hypothetical protein
MVFDSSMVLKTSLFGIGGSDQVKGVYIGSSVSVSRYGLFCKNP